MGHVTGDMKRRESNETLPDTSAGIKECNYTCHAITDAYGKHIHESLPPLVSRDENN